jgi:hypothetical protein
LDDLFTSIQGEFQYPSGRSHERRKEVVVCCSPTTDEFLRQGLKLAELSAVEPRQRGCGGLTHLCDVVLEEGSQRVLARLAIPRLRKIGGVDAGGSEPLWL